jgi:predicted PhzF superfamily epimerase YddE/YHI9
MEFPDTPATPVEVPPTLTEALGAGVQVKNIVAICYDFLMEVASESIVRRIQPDFLLPGKIPVRGVIITSRAGSCDYDFVSRFFGPAVGSNEDPVTGSAHCFFNPDFRE